MRSKFEEKVLKYLQSEKVNYTYESLKLRYSIPVTYHVYTPDVLLDNGIVIEIKGFNKTDWRKKMLLVKEQHPLLDIRFVFQNPNLPIYKNSKTTYCQWAEKNGFKWCKGPTIPEDWYS